MSLVFINAVLLPLIALIGVPIVLHLFARAKPPVYLFSSVDFVRRVVRSTMRVKRPQDWILLVLRTLLFVALVLMFLRPLFFAKKRLGGLFDRKNVILVVDATASMGYSDGARTRFATACAEASEILSGLSARDAANIVWLSADPKAVFSEPGVNLGYLQGELRKGTVTSESGDPTVAIRMAERMLDGLEGKREICILSDFQASTWGETSLEVSPEIDLVTVKISKEDGLNGAVAEVQCDPASPLVGEDVTIYCEVRNYEPTPRRRSVFLSVGESRLSRDVMVPGWGKATAVFTYRFANPGETVVTASLDADRFGGDDRRWRVVPVSEFLTVGVLGRDLQSASIWSRALRSLRWADASVLTPEELEGDLEYDVLVLAGWQGEGVDSIRSAMAAGASVVCLPAADSDPAPFYRLLGEEPAVSASSWSWEESSEEHRIELAAANDALFTLFAKGEYGDVTRGSFRGRLNVTTNALPPSGKPLLAYEDGVPALVRYRPGAHLFLWNLSLDPKLSSWAGQVEFVPFVGELLLSCRRSEVLPSAATVEAGLPLSYVTPRRVLVSDVELLDREGETLPLTAQTAGRLRFVTEERPEPGVYTWSHQGKTLAHGAVNFPTVESDLRVLTVDQVESKGAVTVDGGSRVRVMRDGLPLWRYFLVAALCLAVMEGVALFGFERK